ncbi:(2Fe-2S)-binding protein (plasmid) [Skermanella sp. TT6]|uniref:(2Fe-2S)-binding protein n=1 Tax=Skermanella cutis TaxID=2775420 RepID=A0ABX7BEJ8_9PROT|nr:(2Fe-2S)-binding protein [Skermanella sp. TT6]QQP92811.1 (2Fe-2S)-binding protein [Skermanella sp. TT6]
MTGTSFVLNGRVLALDAPDNAVLADLLRDVHGLYGCRIGCDQAVCGACTVLVDGAPMAACSTFAFEVAGRAVVTIEGMASADGTLDPVQRAFVEERGFQCGYCTAGIILTVRALLDRDPDPDEAVIRSWLGANVCRCTGYSAIISAVRAAARLRREEGA